LRHAATPARSDSPPVFTTGALRVDLVRQQVFVNEQEVHLTPIEYKLLATLVRHAGKVVTHRQLLREGWGPAYLTEAQYVRVYMGQLRHKLEVDPARPQYVRTEPGVGYRLLVE
jgi:two-component system, OmpR family, KDP operon response regulator KdpE